MKNIKRVAKWHDYQNSTIHLKETSGEKRSDGGEVILEINND
jgi:hypothetical protein